MSDQFLRYCKLGVTNSAGNGLDLSEFRVVFNVHQSDFESPNHAEITVYNLSQEKMNSIAREYGKVHLEAGYLNGNHGTIFEGTISQFKIGRESNTDSYFTILAMDGDLFYNDTYLATSVSARSTLDNEKQAIVDNYQKIHNEQLQIDPPPRSVAIYWATPSLRGVVLFGLARSKLRNLATKMNKSWSIQEGIIGFVDTVGYVEDTIVEINSRTGMIGVPIQTEQGIMVRCLLNQKIRIGTLISLNAEDINRTKLNSLIRHDSFTGIEYVAPLSPLKRATYCVLVAEYSGDTRGEDWQVDVTAMAVDESGKVLLTSGNPP